MIITALLSTITIILTVNIVAAAESSCISCHSNRDMMQRLGYPHLTVSEGEVAAQSGHKAACVACHRGDGTAEDKDKAHTGITRLVVVRKQGLIGQTPERKQPLLFTGNAFERIKFQSEQEGKPVIDPSVHYILYGDKRPDTLSADFALLEQTCGKCHWSQFDEFTRSTMARNGKQSSYKGWAAKDHGPHNCGAWFEGNRASIERSSNLPFPASAAEVNQRTCNSCHIGCLDCHYYPQSASIGNPKEGMHTFQRKPKPVGCYGGGRGSTCHAGPEERRRGAGYFGGPFSYPEGATPDIHATKGIGCLDCHETISGKKLGHAMVKRQVTCIKCHQTIQMSHGRSVHRTLSCEACHIRNIGGYQGTYWGPGKQAGIETPFFKYKDYYGIMKESFLIRDQKGRWIPVKPFPMAVLNQKAAPFKPGLHWRWPKSLPDLGRTDDAWGYVGIYDGLPENNKALLWIQMDKLSHKYGPSRPCESCHELEGNEQKQTVSWEYSDKGADQFTGQHTVVGTRKGLFITGIKATQPIEPEKGIKLSSFAPWSFWPEKWRVKGDFSLPALKNRTLYEAASKDPGKARSLRVVH